jgi:hypothetical protein
MRRHAPRRQKRPECLRLPWRPHGGTRNGITRRRLGGNNLAHLKFDQEITARLVIDPYNDFISEGGKVWDRLKTVAEANNCVPQMLQVLTAARKAGLRVFWNGYLPPAEFVPQLLVAQAQTLLRLQGEPGPPLSTARCWSVFPPVLWRPRRSTPRPWRCTNTVTRHPICLTPGVGSRRSTRAASGG